MPSFYDLNINFSSKEAKNIPSFLSTIESFGYSAIAINRTFHSKVPNKIDSLHELFSQQSKSLIVFTRVTIILDDPSVNFGLHQNNPSLKGIHLVAATPTTEKFFQLCCTQLEIDIISLDLSQKLPFYLKHAMIGVAIHRGIFFEVSYSNSLIDPSNRRQFMSNVMNLIQVTKGKNIILTSGAYEIFQLRSAYDGMNLLNCLGLSLKDCQKCLLENAKSALYHAATRKYTINGIIALEPQQDHAIVKEDKKDPLAIYCISLKK